MTITKSRSVYQDHIQVWVLKPPKIDVFIVIDPVILGCVFFCIDTGSLIFSAGDAQSVVSGTRHVTNPSIGPSIGEMSIGMTNSLRYQFLRLLYFLYFRKNFISKVLALSCKVKSGYSLVVKIHQKNISTKSSQKVLRVCIVNFGLSKLLSKDWEVFSLAISTWCK